MVERRIVEQRRLHRSLGARMQQLHASADIFRAQVHVRGMIDHHLAHAEHAREECRHAPELVLAPVLVRMIVALRAIEAAPHEDADLFGHGVGRSSDLVVRQEMAGRRFVAFGGDALARDLVVRAVALDVGANPLPVFLPPLGRQAVAENGDAERGRQSGRSSSRRTPAMPISASITFRACRGSVLARNSRTRSRRRKRAGEVETDAAQKFGIARRDRTERSGICAACRKRNRR